MTALCSTDSPIRYPRCGYNSQRQVMMAGLSPRVRSPCCRTGIFPRGYMLRYYLLRCCLAMRSTEWRVQGMLPISMTVLTALPGWLPSAQCNFIYISMILTNEYLYIIQITIIMEPEQAERPPQEEQNDAQQYDTFLYKFQQQIIDAWKPVPHTGSNVVLYIILSAICIGLGLGLVLSAPNHQEVYVRYDNDSTCQINTTCTKDFTLTQTLPAPVYFYYGFKGFYQNHRRYLKYYSSIQLQTGTIDATGVSTDCGDFVTNQQTFGAGNASRFNNNNLTSTSTAFPCGTIARFYYMLQPQIKGFSIAGVTIDPTGIAWPSDIGRHKNPTDTSQIGFDVTDQAWLVWFRPAARSDFYKLNGVINQDIAPGTYTVTINNQVNATFGEKWFSLSKSNFVGNRDLFLGIAFLALGVGCILLLIVFFSKWIAEKRDRQKFQ